MNYLTQNERLDYLLEEFKKDSVQYADLRNPSDVNGKRRLLRSLMNIRMPAGMKEEVLEVQNRYLKERIRENGVVKRQDIPTAADMGSRHDFAEMIAIWQGDITRLAVGAIVNAANSRMLGCFIPMHTCIDNCIHTYAGIQLRYECNRQMNKLRSIYGSDYRQPVAVPMLTDGYNLPAEKIVHVVGPTVTGKLTEELKQQLADCYRNTLDICRDNGISTVAFCCISTGVFRFPNKSAAEIAVQTVTGWLKDHPGKMSKVIFNVFKDEDRKLYEEQLQQ